MPFQSYSQLQTAALQWLDRAGDPDAVARAPDWISLAETRIRRLQEWFVQVFSLTADGGDGDPLDVPQSPVELPNFVKEVKSLWASTGQHTHDIPIVGVDEWRGMTAKNRDAQGVPRLAVIVPQMDAFLVDPDGTGPLTKRGARLFLWPRPQGEFAVDFKYIRDVPPLSPTVLNGLFLRHPDVYLYAVLAEAAPYLQHDERLALWEGRFQAAVVEINQERERAELGASSKRVRFESF